MALAAGTRLGPYEIGAPLGAGGMGEVYRATDTNLARQVAIKVLPEALATDPERLARFDREAKTLAALNHPNIAHIYGLERAAAATALVMELVEGPTLAETIAKGALPVDEAIPIARQIAEALEAAHEMGIVHRDLKPANVKVRPDGTVKVLDFGLAKAIESQSAAGAVSVNLTQSPTITTPAMTQLGMILGTAAYMSPEQARGKPIDKRTDIWAFGCVFYEMLTGRPAFQGEDVSDTLANVLKVQPEFRAVPGDLPASIRTLLEGCLAKDPKQRVAAASIVRYVLEHQETPPLALKASHDSAFVLMQWRRRRVVFGAALAATALLAVLASWLAFSPTTVPGPGAITFGLTPPERWQLSATGVSVAVSNDGLRVAFVARAVAGNEIAQLWLRELQTLEARMLPGTSGAASPFWAPDGRSVAFVANGQLRRVSIAGGPSLRICDVPSFRGGTWGPDGTIVFSPDNGPLMKVSSTGGMPVPVSMLGEGELRHVWPTFLPDGRHFLFGVGSADAEVPVYVGSLDSSERTMVLRTDAANVLLSAGHVLFLRETTLMRQAFDSAQLTVMGEAVALVDNVATNTIVPPVMTAAASPSGTLVYSTANAGTTSKLVWFDRAGTRLGELGAEGAHADLEISPDGNQVASSIRDPVRRNADVWLYDVARGLRNRLTSDPSDDFQPVWSPDGARVLFASRRNGPQDLFVATPSRTQPETAVARDTANKFPNAWTPDGKSILYGFSVPRSGFEIMLLERAGDPDARPRALLQTAFSEGWIKVSPDGRWVVYRSDESGRFELYVSAFPTLGRRWLISNAGAHFPRWRADGKEIFYRAPDNRLVAVSVQANGDDFTVGKSEVLFEVPSKGGVIGGYEGWRYDVLADGRRFLVDTPVAANASPTVTVVVNWAAVRDP